MGTCFSSSSSRRDMNMVDEYYSTMRRGMHIPDQYHTSRQRDINMIDQYYPFNQRDMNMYYPFRQRDMYIPDKHNSSRQCDVTSVSSDEDVLEDKFYSPRRSFDASQVSSDEKYARELQEALFASLPTSTGETNHHPQVHNDIPTFIRHELPVIKTENDRARTENELSIWTKYQERQIQPENDWATWIDQLAESTVPAPWMKQPELEIKSENDSTTWINPFSEINQPATSKEQERELETEAKPAKPSGGFCLICMEEKHPSEIFQGTCTHSYCTECTIRYVTTKIEENVANIKCPDMKCTQVIQPHTCRNLITKDMFELWDKNLCDSWVLSWEKLDCPFEGCSATMVVDDEEEGENARETECPSCHRLFCAQCKVKWHAGFGCEEFQRFRNNKKKTIKSSESEDNLLIKVAERKKWRRCPKCKIYVEKINGCRQILCRCGCMFCYDCGFAAGYHHLCPKPPKRTFLGF